MEGSLTQVQVDESINPVVLLLETFFKAFLFLDRKLRAVFCKYGITWDVALSSLNHFLNLF